MWRGQSRDGCKAFRGEGAWEGGGGDVGGART